VKLVMTVVARNEADVLDAQLRFHLAAGVDHVFAVDHGSTDGTGEILESFARQGVLELVREDGDFHQGRWVSEFARRAASELGADWVIHPDADEFWWPRGGDLKDALAAIPDRIGVVYGYCSTFLPAVGEGPFAERMTARLAPAGPLNDPATSFRPWLKVAHRARPDVVVALGNHALLAGDLEPLRAWYPIEILHFNVRTFEQFERKARAHHTVIQGGRRGDAAAIVKASAEGRLRELYDRICVDAEAVARGVERGVLVVDTRVRDALRAIAAGRSIAFEPAPRIDARSLDQLLAPDSVNLVRAYRRVDVAQRSVAAIRSRTLAERVRSHLTRRRRG
jgi:hypothetical protein